MTQGTLTSDLCNQLGARQRRQRTGGSFRPAYVGCSSADANPTPIRLRSIRIELKTSIEPCMKNNMTTYVENIYINILCISSNLKSRCACLTQLQVQPRLVFCLPRPVAMSDLPGAGLELFVRREKNVERI